MKLPISRRGFLPQLEPNGRLGKWLTRLGGAKMLVQRSGVVANKITMVSALTAMWSTTPRVQGLFFNSFSLFIGSVFVAISIYGIVDHGIILPGEQGYTQEQAHTAERSPLKRDTEKLIEQQQEFLERLDADQAPVADGGEQSDTKTESQSHCAERPRGNPESNP